MGLGQASHQAAQHAPFFRTGAFSAMVGLPAELQKLGPMDAQGRGRKATAANALPTLLHFKASTWRGEALVTSANGCHFCQRARHRGPLEDLGFDDETMVTTSMMMIHKFEAAIRTTLLCWKNLAVT